MADEAIHAADRSVRTISLLVARFLLYLASAQGPARRADGPRLRAWLAEWNLEVRPKGRRTM